MLRQFAWKNQIFSSICLAISRKFAWKNRFDFFTRIHDPQISNQFDAAASWKVTYPRIIHRRVIEKQYFARVSTFYLSIYGTYIAPFKVTTQKRSQPNRGQKGLLQKLLQHL